MKLPKHARKRKQLHISGLNTYWTCGVQFEFSYIEGIKRRPGSGLIVGSAVDSAGTKDLDEKILTGDLLPDSTVLDIARDYVEKEKGSFDLDTDETHDKVKDRAVAHARNYHGKIAPLILPYKTKRKFAINLDDFLMHEGKRLHNAADDNPDKTMRKLLDAQAASLIAVSREGWDLAGEQDVVEKYEIDSFHANESNGGSTTVLHVRDIKTSSKSPNENTAEVSEQLTAYALASEVLDEKLPDYMMLDYSIVTPARKEEKTKTLITTRTSEDMQVFKNRLTNAVHGIRTGIFIPARPDDWRCSADWCGYFNICRYAKRPKSAPVPAPLVNITT
jgi:hypothetical protein